MMLAVIGSDLDGRCCCSSTTVTLFLQLIAEEDSLKLDTGTRACHLTCVCRGPQQPDCGVL
jgi:hypothetical protein